MNEYVIQNSELEGHFEHFQDRKSLWDNLKKGRLTIILRQLDNKLCARGGGGLGEVDGSVVGK